MEVKDVGRFSRTTRQNSFPAAPRPRNTGRIKPILRNRDSLGSVCVQKLLERESSG